MQSLDVSTGQIKRVDYYPEIEIIRIRYRNGDTGTVTGVYPGKFRNARKA